MEKIMEITKDQFLKLRKAKNKEKILKEIIGLPKDGKYTLGDSTILIEDATLYEIYRRKVKRHSIYYLIVEVMNLDQAFAWILYPNI